MVPWPWLAAVCSLAILLSPARAQQSLLEEEPFDRITLNEQNDNAVLRIEPLPQSVRRRVSSLRPSDKLTVRLLDQPEKVYEIQWHSVAKLELFEQIVLAEASRLVGAGKLDEAYDYFHFLETRYPQLPGLSGAMEDYLYEEAKRAQRSQEYDLALAMLQELHARNPERPGLGKALGIATDKLVEAYLAEGDYASVRKLLRGLADWYPEEPVVAARAGQLKSEAAALLADARRAVQAGELQRAAELTRRVLRIWPQLPDARPLAESIHQRYPRVAVGVVTLAGEGPMNRLADWAARRSGRLLYRTLTEFTGPGPEGGTYDCPIGEKQVDTLEGRLIVQVRPDLRWADGTETLTGYDVSRRLLAMADPGDPAYHPGWADVFGGVTVRGVYRVSVELRTAHVRPDAMLQTVLIPYPAASRSAAGPPTNGPYILHSRTDRQATYLANPQYFAAVAAQPKEIVERRYARGTDAIRALQRGEIQVVDRLNPWDWKLLQSDESLQLKQYRLPLVHCLVPNLTNLLTRRRGFRRALVYGINRQAILEQLLDGAERPGCRVISGPFPPGVSFDDPIGYAYDEEIEPRGYEPRLAIALATLALKEVAADAARQGRKIEKMPSLVLGHPADEIARVACLSIQRQLKLVGIPIELRELEGPVPAALPAEVDLLYAELAAWEPVTDARPLLGPDGMSGGCSPYMNLALRRLAQADRWTEIREASGQVLHRGVRSELRKIHRIAHDDVAVVPLWQLTDCLACRKSLSGPGARPVTLYENVEQWRLAFEYPTDALR